MGNNSQGHGQLDESDSFPHPRVNPADEVLKTLVGAEQLSLAVVQLVQQSKLNAEAVRAGVDFLKSQGVVDEADGRVYLSRGCVLATLRGKLKLL